MSITLKEYAELESALHDLGAAITKALNNKLKRKLFSEQFEVAEDSVTFWIQEEFCGCCQLEPAGFVRLTEHQLKTPGAVDEAVRIYEAGIEENERRKRELKAKKEQERAIAKEADERLLLAKLKEKYPND